MRSLRSLGAGQRQRPGTELGRQQSIDLTLAVVQPCRKAADAFAIDQSVGDQAHRPADDIGADVPLRRSRRRVGAASLARSIPMLLSGGGRDEALDVLALRRHRRTARSAIDPRRLHGRDEAPVEPAVAALRGSVALFVVEDHDVIVSRPVIQN